MSSLPSRETILKKVNTLFDEGKLDEGAKLLVAYTYLRIDPEKLANRLTTMLMLHSCWMNAMKIVNKIGWSI